MSRDMKMICQNAIGWAGTLACKRWDLPNYFSSQMFVAFVWHIHKKSEHKEVLDIQTYTKHLSCSLKERFAIIIVSEYVMKWFQELFLKSHCLIKSLPQYQCLPRFLQFQLTVEVNLRPSKKIFNLEKPTEFPGRLTVLEVVYQQFVLLDLLHLFVDPHVLRYQLTVALFFCPHLIYEYPHEIRR